MREGNNIDCYGPVRCRSNRRTMSRTDRHACLATSVACDDPFVAQSGGLTKGDLKEESALLTVKTTHDADLGRHSDIQGFFEERTAQRSINVSSKATTAVASAIGSTEKLGIDEPYHDACAKCVERCVEVSLRPAPHPLRRDRSLADDTGVLAAQHVRAKALQI
jgi:hypothetical protein